MLDRVAERIENRFYPELRSFDRAKRARMLRKASETPLDLIEWVGILFGLVVVAAATRYGAQSFGIVDRLAVLRSRSLAGIGKRRC
jgi:hypothetical protein